MTRSSSLVVGVRLVVLLVAAGAVVAAFEVRRGGGGGGGVSPGAGPSYVCPMHPRVTARSPGRCPICGMALEPAGVRAAEPPDPQRFDIARRRVFSQELHAPAWIESDGLVSAILYNDEAGGLAPDEPGSFLPASARAARVEVRAAPERPVPWDGATARARFRPVAGASAGPPGAVGWLMLPARTREVLVVPSSAVLDSPRGPYVLGAASDEGEPERRPVVIGKALFGVTTVVSGLREGERIVRNAFFIDAERRLRGATAP